MNSGNLVLSAPVFLLAARIECSGEALKAFFPITQGKKVRLLMDDKTAVSYVMKLGERGVCAFSKSYWKSSSLPKFICWTCRQCTFRVLKTHLTSRLSRKFFSHGEWKLNPKYLSEIFARWGTPEVVLIGLQTIVRPHSFSSTSFNHKS